jgi:hypothetical protein
LKQFKGDENAACQHLIEKISGLTQQWESLKSSNEIWAGNLSKNLLKSILTSSY